MSKRDGQGYWNRAARRSGGERSFRILVGTRAGIDTMVAGIATVGPFCTGSHHELCSGPCDCECHHPKPGEAGFPVLP